MKTKHALFICGMCLLLVWGWAFHDQSLPVAYAAVSLSDTFDGTSVDTNLWDIQPWGLGTYSPTVASSLVNLPGGGALLSKASFDVSPTDPLGVFEAKATFGAGVYQHIGFATTDGNDLTSFLIFSTAATNDTLYARISGASSMPSPGYPINISNFDMTQPHTYRIEWAESSATEDTVTFLIDGAVVYTSASADGADIHNGLSNLNVVLSNNGAATLVVDSVNASTGPISTVTPTTVTPTTVTPTTATPTTVTPTTVTPTTVTPTTVTPTTVTPTTTLTPSTTPITTKKNIFLPLVIK